MLELETLKQLANGCSAIIPLRHGGHSIEGTVVAVTSSSTEGRNIKGR